jgi:nicotinamidase-related amidase
MAIDLAPFLEPSRCAVIVFECQQNIIGRGSRIPGLVAAVQQRGLVPQLARLLTSARSAGARVFFCTAEARSDGLGRARTPLHERQQRSPAPAGNTADTRIVPELGPEKSDVVISRSHGMSGFHDTGLDPCLRDLEIRTVILAGVSLNIGVVGTAIEAVNHGYRVIVAADCAVGDPPEYGDQVLRYTLRNLAYVSTSEQIAAIWQDGAGGRR